MIKRKLKKYQLGKNGIYTPSTDMWNSNVPNFNNPYISGSLGEGMTPLDPKNSKYFADEFSNIGGNVFSPTSMWDQNANINSLPPQSNEGIFTSNQSRDPISPESLLNTTDEEEESKIKRKPKFGFNPAAYAKLQALNGIVDGIGNIYQQNQQNQSRINMNPLSGLDFSNGRSEQSKYGYSFKKGGVKPKVYTDRKQFEQAQRMYNDSLNLYLEYKDIYNRRNDSKEFEEKNKHLVKNNIEAYEKPFLDYSKEVDAFNKVKSKIKPISRVQLMPELYDDFSVNKYKKPVQPIVYQSHPIQKMSRINPQQMDLNSNINIQGQQVPFPQMQLPQQKGTPVYGPGNTIVGYSDNMNFKPAYEYTGAPNNQLSLQDKELLNNPEALRKYVLSKDNYKFQKGGYIEDDEDFLWGDEENNYNQNEVVEEERMTEEKVKENLKKRPRYDFRSDPLGLFTASKRRLRNSTSPEEDFGTEDYTPATTDITGNQQQAFNYFQQQGMPAHQAAGIVGNFTQESNVNPGITNGIGAFGAGQWLGPRKKALFQFAEAKNLDPYDLNTQLAFTMHELRTIERKAGIALSKTKTSAEAAKVFRKMFERPGEHEANDKRRIQEAMKLYPYQEGGMNGMIKGKIATEAHFGNPSAMRMVKPINNPYIFTGNEVNGNGTPFGSQGTHFMGSYGNQVRPSIQDINGSLQYLDNPGYSSKENMNFNNEEEAEYFAKWYKNIAPMMRKKKKGGQVKTDNWEIIEY